MRSSRHRLTRQFQVAALSGLPSSQALARQSDSPAISFEKALAKAKSAVQNLMYFGDLLTKSLYYRDKQQMEELQAVLDSISR